jgi:hypothetical protein
MECETCATRGWIHPSDGTGYQCCGGHAGHLGLCSVYQDTIRSAEIRFAEVETVELGRLTPAPDRSVALGYGSRAIGPSAVAIGPNAEAPPLSLAIAWGEPKRQIVIDHAGNVTLHGFEDDPMAAAAVFWSALEEFNPLLQENAQLVKKVNEFLGRLERIRHLASKSERTGAVLDQIGRLASVDEPFHTIKEFPNGIVRTIESTQTRPDA